ncbi:MAG: hypothetical protein V4482_01990 [Pseudomonadota bacterium]
MPEDLLQGIVDVMRPGALDEFRRDIPISDHFAKNRYWYSQLFPSAIIARKPLAFVAIYVFSTATGWPRPSDSP